MTEQSGRDVRLAGTIRKLAGWCGLDIAGPVDEGHLEWSGLEVADEQA